MVACFSSPPVPEGSLQICYSLHDVRPFRWVGRCLVEVSTIEEQGEIVVTEAPVALPYVEEKDP